MAYNLISHNTTCGVYVIECSVTNSIYIGASSNVKLRLNGHKSKFNRKDFTDCNPKMIEDILNFGVDAFEFKQFLSCNKDIMLELEQQTIHFYKDYGYRLYNLKINKVYRPKKRLDNLEYLYEQLSPMK